jgi:hypothetical protein
MPERLVNTEAFAHYGSELAAASPVGAPLPLTELAASRRTPRATNTDVIAENRGGAVIAEA